MCRRNQLSNLLVFWMYLRVCRLMISFSKNLLILMILWIICQKCSDQSHTIKITEEFYTDVWSHYWNKQIATCWDYMRQGYIKWSSRFWNLCHKVAKPIISSIGLNLPSFKTILGIETRRWNDVHSYFAVCWIFNSKNPKFEMVVKIK